MADFHGQVGSMEEHAVYVRYDFVDVFESHAIVDFSVQLDVRTFFSTFATKRIKILVQALHTHLNVRESSVFI